MKSVIPVTPKKRNKRNANVFQEQEKSIQSQAGKSKQWETQINILLLKDEWY